MDSTHIFTFLIIDRGRLKRYIEGWLVLRKFAVFLSHYKLEAAAVARVLKMELVRTLRTKDEEVFLDSDNLAGTKLSWSSVSFVTWPVMQVQNYPLTKSVQMQIYATC